MNFLYFSFCFLFLSINAQTEKQCQVIYKYGTIQDTTTCRSVQTDSTTKISTITCHLCESSQYCSINVNLSGKCTSNENDRIEGQKCSIGPNCLSSTCDN